jgi:hypothetical protein
MGKYVYIYYAGKDTDAGDDTAWGNWFGTLGDKIIDAGNPFGDGGQAVHMGGIMSITEKPVTGYSIVTADNLEEATELAKGCPLVASKDGVVCVYEALPM